MNAIIIGCGYVGSAVAQHWRNLGHVITATTTTQERIGELQKVANQVIVLKRCDEETLQTLLQNQDAIFLSVAPKANKQVDAEMYEETYLHTANNLVLALKHFPNIKQLIYTSSCSVYGNSNGAWVSELSPVAPANRHSEILHETEQVLLSASTQDLRVCIFRLGTMYAPDREFKQRLSKLAGTTRPGTGNHFTNWIHLDDIVSASELALARQLQGVYNLVNDVPITARELFKQLCDRYELPEVEWDGSDTTERPKNRRISNQKLKAEGYQLIHPEVEI
ncbi:NAD-dependent epimerase/dehydratase [Oscillatoria nigro-viridis PCC 7112]|uniref:NAD-dependent epimerase/dehydratase n=1 Tax=Phormidium nigroviride PCC 7112 TaxID=179408 RepID=K9VI91_9CYAN|nr:SDR family oxidoreductase [Oscillatoria nigro-viridis]AFZ07207.1 NAD-dependent epimerase/dehydratase [Oscillatoria nigro-viridis PCC 7112]